MPNALLERLEAKIDALLDALQASQSEVQALQKTQTTLHSENVALKDKLSQWEAELSGLLKKLEPASPHAHHKLPQR